MGEHADKTHKTLREDDTRSLPAQDHAERPGREIDWRGVRDTTVGFLAGLARWIGLVFAAILVLHVIFVVGDANPGNGIVSFVSGWADTFSLGFKDLFTPADAKLKVLVNDGIAALFWLVAGALVARIIRRVGGAAS
jgi:hypothetical protein